MSKIKIVAEIGCNHNGDKELAKKMISTAAACGVDAVKFQTFQAEKLASIEAPKAEYQIKNDVGETQLEMLKKLELSQKDYLELVEYAHKENCDIFSTAFDEESVIFLAKLGQKIWKIPSGEITNLVYLEKIAMLDIPGKEIILSTGMATLDEIDRAVKIFEKEKNITILHCNTNYPTQDSDVNLLAIKVLRKRYSNCKVGFSDHSLGITAPLIACGMGISFIEKHFTLDTNLPGPDHKASIMPNELRLLCQEIQRGEILLGMEKKFVTKSEEPNKWIARKSIVAQKNIKKGEIYTQENLTCKRPGNGISPMHWYELLGERAESNFKQDQLITHSKFKWEKE